MTRRNLVMLPLVILIRLPVMCPLFLLATVGKVAEAVSEGLNPYLPTLVVEKRTIDGGSLWH